MSKYSDQKPPKSLDSIYDRPEALSRYDDDFDDLIAVSEEIVEEVPQELPSTVPVKQSTKASRVTNETLADAEIRAVAQLPFGPIRHIDPATIRSRADLVGQLAKRLPLNEYSLPQYLYRPDMLDTDTVIEVLQEYYQAKRREGTIAYDDTTTTMLSFPPEKAAVRPAGMSDEQLNERIADVVEILTAAQLPVYYDEGFPALGNGQAIWQQFDFEPADAYNAFVLYIGQEGVRQTSKIEGYDPSLLRDYFNMYFWPIRARALEYFRTVSHQKSKIGRMMTSEEKHYRFAEKIMAKVVKYLEDVDFNDNNITPDKAVAMFEKLVKVQRISVGLPANGESKENTGVRSVQPVNVIMQQVTRTSAEQVGDDVSDIVEAEEILMQDAETVELAQQLIVNMQDQKRSSNSGGESA